MNNTYLDGMMGLITGDALGSPAQFHDRSVLKENPITKMEYCEIFNTIPGTWTDDSSLALATLSSLISKKIYNLNDIADNFVLWLEKGDFTPHGYAFDIGMGCERGILKYEKTKDAKTSGPSGDKDNGNGSLMRILPLCIYYAKKAKIVCTSDDESIQAIHEVSAITHGHIRAKMACGLYYFCVKHVINDRDKKSLIVCLQEGIDEGLKYYGHDLRNLTEMSYYGKLFDLLELKELPETDIVSSGYVVRTIEAAMWCLVNTDTYENCLLKAVNLGDDTDTVGAIAGGIAGLYYGYENIPDDWKNAIVKRVWIENMCKEASEII